MRPLHVLVVADFTAQPCGIRNFADQTFTALRRHQNLAVTIWDIHYPLVYARREAGVAYGGLLPLDADRFDVIHVNWHPLACNILPAGIFPGGPLISVYLNDLPPHSTCPFVAQTHVRFAAEPYLDSVVLPYPIADWVALPQGLPHQHFQVGASSVRQDGLDAIAHVCKTHGWTLQGPDRSRWRTFEEEVQRQAVNTVNVCWYTEDRGISGGASQALASRRPLVLNDSLMFSHYHGYPNDIYWGTKAEGLQTILAHVWSDWTHSRLKLPRTVLQERSWSWGAQRMVDAWREAAR